VAHPQCAHLEAAADSVPCDSTVKGENTDPMHVRPRRCFDFGIEMLAWPACRFWCVWLSRIFAIRQLVIDQVEMRRTIVLDTRT